MKFLRLYRKTLEEALGVDDDEVTMDATLQGDLGAESIDFLDILFRLEKGFDIKIPRGELFPENLASADSSFVQDGKSDRKRNRSVERKKMPHADVDKLAEDPAVENIADLFTVRMMVNFLDQKLNG